MSKHTSGPWIQESGRISGHSDKQVIKGSPNSFDWIASVQISNSPQWEANAKLIAAAPDMLDMLETIENDGKQVPEWLWDRIQKVIAKAKGEQQ